MDNKNDNGLDKIMGLLKELQRLKEAREKGTEELLRSLLNPKDGTPCATIGEDEDKYFFGTKDGDHGLFFHMMRQTDDFIIRLVDLSSGKEKKITTSKKEFIQKHLNQELLEAPYITYKTPFGDLVRFNQVDVALYISFLKSGGGVK